MIQPKQVLWLISLTFILSFRLKGQNEIIKIKFPESDFLKVGSLNFNALSNKEISRSYDLDIIVPLRYLRPITFVGLGVISPMNKKTMLFGKLGLNFNLNKKQKLGLGINYNYIFSDKSSVFNLQLIKNLYLFSFDKKYLAFLNFKAGISYFSFNNSFLFEIGSGITFGERIYYKKPILYFYSKDTLDLDVNMHFNGQLKFSFPQYHDKWEIKVFPNSDIIDKTNGNRYQYLFWEGEYKKPQKDRIKTGFIVNKNEMTDFLIKKLSEIGLNYREINDFITYWVPGLEHEKYLIHFVQNEECNQICSYYFNKQPESFIRLIVWFVELDSYEKDKIEEQKLIRNYRKDFTVVEWGGAIIK